MSAMSGRSITSGKAAKFSGTHRLFILEGASRSWELGYSDELEKVAGEVPWLTYVPTVSRPWEDKGWSGETGRVDDLIRKYTDHVESDAREYQGLSLRPPGHD